MKHAEAIRVIQRQIWLLEREIEENPEPIVDKQELETRIRDLKASRDRLQADQ